MYLLLIGLFLTICILLFMICLSIKAKFFDADSGQNTAENSKNKNVIYFPSESDRIKRQKRK